MINTWFISDTHPNKKNIIGHTFGKLLVVSEAGKDRWGQYKWQCICYCGNTTISVGGNLRNGHTISCGCEGKKSRLNGLKKSISKRIKHGHVRVKSGKRSPEYSIYHSMIQRCTNNKCTSYFNYGGRGISICNRWLNGSKNKSGFQCFIEDMGKRPHSILTLDRINNDGNYEKKNCRWTTRKVQQNNTRKQKSCKQNNLTPIHADIILERAKEITG